MTPRRGRPRRYRRPRPRCGADYLALLLTPRRSYVHAVGRWTDSPASALTVNVHRFMRLVVGPSVSGSTKANDAYLTSKVKARFVSENRFKANHVKVITENSTVYLLGLVNRQEGDDAAEIASTTGGVLKVVKVFEYL